jgi:ribosomal protein S12
MTTRTRFTSADLELLPDLPGVRYEIIAGEPTRWRNASISACTPSSKCPLVAHPKPR